MFNEEGIIIRLEKKYWYGRVSIDLNNIRLKNIRLLQKEKKKQL